MAQWYRNRLPVQEMQEIQAQALGREDPLEEEIAAHSSILAWKNPPTEEPGGLQSGSHKSWTWLSDGAHIFKQGWGYGRWQELIS